MSDEGSGLPPEMLERIFERFTRHQPSASPTGAGLGLPICRSIAGLHKGVIRAENRDDRGDRGSLRLIFEW
jgi:two-component system sensor histidine kinase KdpD